MAAIGFGMFVFTAAAIFVGCAVAVGVVHVCALTAGGGICETFVFVWSDDLRFDEIIFNLLSALVDDDFCAFCGAAILLSLMSADTRAGLLSFFSDFFVSVSLLELFDEDDNSFDFVFDADGSVFCFALLCAG